MKKSNYEIGGIYFMTPKKQAYQTLANTMIQNFQKRNIEAFYCEDSESAVELAMRMMEDANTISFGGSETLEETGLLDAIRNSSHEVVLVERNAAKTPAEKKEIFLKSMASDYFLMSSNAITIDGELINIDGNGNRVACLIHGPEHVIIVAGMNKVVADVESGIARVRNVSAPANAARLGTKTPCGATGHCGNCDSPDCMCCQIVVTRHSRHTGRIKVILVGETLGY